MSSQTVVMPQLGESVMEGVVVKWLVNEGEKVDVDTPLCEVETDKASVEIPSPIAGFVAKHLVVLDDLVEVGESLVEISTEKPEGVAAAPVKAEAAPAPAQEPSSTPQPASATPEPPAQDSPTFTSPSLPPAPAMGAPLPSMGPAQWTNMAPTPPARHTPRADAKPAKPGRWLPFGHPEGAKAFRYPKPVVAEGDTVEKFTRRRQIIAEHMVVSQSVSPHVVTVAEVDMTEIVKLRNAHKHRLKAQGIGLTFLAFILKATVEALGEYPRMNSVVGDGIIIQKGRINLGCAVETPEGLVVPVLKDADQLNLVGLATALSRLAKKARDGDLAPGDVAGGTFTVSNPGLKGNLYGGAIINQPQVGIVRMGEIKKRPMIIQRDGEDVIAVRHMMYVALSYDHRIIDGVTGNAFLFRIRELLEAANFHP
jgi:2-oxoglutarate dehydrogenase E2 component (dihydrolipoamide succinyltransferase)